MKFSGAPSLLKLYVWYFFVLCLLFYLVECVRVITNNHMTKSIIGCLEIFSADKINPKLSILPQANLSNKGRK